MGTGPRLRQGRKVSGGRDGGQVAPEPGGPGPGPWEGLGEAGAHSQPRRKRLTY